MRQFPAFISTVLVASVVTAANADVVVSNAATKGIACSRGICAPTASDAVLNAGDLETLLQSGAISVTTTGSGVEANNIVIRRPLKWRSANALEFTARASITIENAVSVGGRAALSLYMDTGGSGGSLVFAGKGHVTFSHLASALAINGANYTLVADIKSLASAVAANPGGSFALAADYDAAADGTYTAAPIGTSFTGNFEGLGNTIQNLTINQQYEGEIGLFAELSGGRISDIGIIDANITESVYGSQSEEGALLGVDNGSISGTYSTGTVSGAAGDIGGLIGTVGVTGSVDRSHSSAAIVAINDYVVYAAGLVGSNYGMISDSYAQGQVSGNNDTLAGLVSMNAGTIASSFASGAISSYYYGGCGGLVGYNDYQPQFGYIGTIENSYATGDVTCYDPKGDAGGFADYNASTIRKCYSTGTLNGYQAAGFSVTRMRRSPMEEDYWDTTTSGTDKGVLHGSSKDIRGLTSQQLQSRLPKGFSRKIWAQDPNINNGFPYLIANPPPE